MVLFLGLGSQTPFRVLHLFPLGHIFGHGILFWFRLLLAMGFAVGSGIGLLGGGGGVGILAGGIGSESESDESDESGESGESGKSGDGVGVLFNFSVLFLRVSQTPFRVLHLVPAGHFFSHLIFLSSRGSHIPVMGLHRVPFLHLGSHFLLFFVLASAMVGVGKKILSYSVKMGSQSPVVGLG